VGEQSLAWMEEEEEEEEEVLVEGHLTAACGVRVKTNMAEVEEEEEEEEELLVERHSTDACGVKVKTNMVEVEEEEADCLFWLPEKEQEVVLMLEEEFVMEFHASRRKSRPPDRPG